MSQSVPPMTEEQVKRAVEQGVQAAIARFTDEKSFLEQLVDAFKSILGHVVALAFVIALVFVVRNNSEAFTTEILATTKTLIGLGILLYTGKEAVRGLRQTVVAESYRPTIAARDISLTIAGVGAGVVLLVA